MGNKVMAMFKSPRMDFTSFGDTANPVARWKARTQPQALCHSYRVSAAIKPSIPEFPEQSSIEGLIHARSAGMEARDVR
jgi:hypothetical protein